MNEQYKQDFLKAGALAKEVRAFGKSLVKTGASYNSVIAAINQKITALGAIAAFPPQLALNDVAAHYLPQPDEDIIFSDEVVKLDIGVCYNGGIGDCAVTIDLSGKHQVLIDAAESALLAAEKSIRVGQPVREIGKIIAETIASFGVKAIRNLAGHGLGPYKIHTAPSIPNYDDKSKAIVKPGMTFAIEPFATNGNGLIYETGAATIFSQIAELARVPVNLQTLFAKIKSYNGLPFAIHDLVGKDLPLLDVRLGLEKLLKSQVIAGYGPLVEEAKGFVAQAENSVLVDDDGKVFITTR